jgi:iron complex transport system substrate-binding protein
MCNRLRRGLIGIGLAVTVIVAGCGESDASAPVAGAVRVPDCAGRAMEFPEVPARVVAIDGYAVQTMVRLGLIDRIVGTGFPAPFTVDAPAYREQLATVPVAGDRGLAMEQVAALDPDMVLTSYTDFDTDMNLTTLGVPGIAGCMPSGKNAGTVTGLTLTYDYIRKIGMVFRVQDRAETLITELKERERAVAARIGNGPKPRVLILVDNPVPGQPIKASGRTTISSGIVAAAGGDNIMADLTGMHADVSPEELIRRDPEVIWVITDYRAAKVKGAELVAKVRTNPIIGQTTAGEQQRIIASSQYLVSFPSPLNLDGLEQLAAGLDAARQ